MNPEKQEKKTSLLQYLQYYKTIKLKVLTFCGNFLSLFLLLKHMHYENEADT